MKSRFFRFFSLFKSQSSQLPIVQKEPSPIKSTNIPIRILFDSMTSMDHKSVIDEYVSILADPDLLPNDLDFKLTQVELDSCKQKFLIYQGPKRSRFDKPNSIPYDKMDIYLLCPVITDQIPGCVRWLEQHGNPLAPIMVIVDSDYFNNNDEQNIEDMICDEATALGLPILQKPTKSNKDEMLKAIAKEAKLDLQRRQLAQSAEQRSQIVLAGTDRFLPPVLGRIVNEYDASSFLYHRKINRS